VDAGQRSEPDDALKPSTLGEISPHSWRYLARRTLHEFLRDDCLAVLATVVWLAASALFGLFVANFSNFDATYGSLAGAIVFLVWLWLTKTAVLLGAEPNAEIERARELQAGVVAERHVQLPARDTRGSRKRSAQRQQDLAAGREIRQQHGQTEDPADRPE
jgi:membrane protein